MIAARLALNATVVFSLVLTGCAAVGEREVFDDLARIEAGFAGPGALLPELTEESTIEDYLSYAARNNPGLQAAAHRWRAAAEAVTQARALPDPMLSYMIEGEHGVDMHSFMLSQTFPWFGKLSLRGRAALDAARAEFQRYEAARLALAFRVKDAYHEYYYLRRAIAVTEENMLLLKNLESVLRTKYEAGGAMLSELIRVQVELGKIEDELRTLQTMRSPIVARLNAALNRPPAAPLPWPGDVTETAVDFRDEDLFPWLAENNPELKAMAAEVAKEENRIELARKSYWPDPTIGLGLTNRDRDMQMGMDTKVFSVGFNLPIWYGKLAAEVNEARAAHRAAVRERDDRTNSLSAEMQMLAWRFRNASRKLALYRDTLTPKAIEALKATQKAFEGGKADFTDFIDAQRTLLEFQLMLERSLVDREQRLAEIEALAGRELPRAARPDAKTQGRGEPAAPQAGASVKGGGR